MQITLRLIALIILFFDSLVLLHSAKSVEHFVNSNKSMVYSYTYSVEMYIYISILYGLSIQNLTEHPQLNISNLCTNCSNINHMLQVFLICYAFEFSWKNHILNITIQSLPLCTNKKKCKYLIEYRLYNQFACL